MNFRCSWICLTLCLVLSAVPLVAGESAWTSIGPDGGWIKAVAAAPSHPFVLYAGVAGRGLYRSTNRGRSWGFTGSPGALIHDLAVDPADPGTLYAALETGLSKSTDGGASFQGVGPRLLPGQGRPVTALVIDPASSSTIYAGVRGELLRSLDAGARWARAGADLQGDLGDFLETTRYGLLAGTSLGLFLSTDRAATFQAAHRGISFGIDELEIDGQDPPRLYARLGSRVLATADRGAHLLDVGPPANLSDPPYFSNLDPSDPSILYAGTDTAGVLMFDQED